MDEGTLNEYCRTLAGLTEEELDISLDKANRENDSNFAPAPGVIYNIAMEMRDGGWAEIDNSPVQYDATWLEDDEWKELKDTLAKVAAEKEIRSEGARAQDRRCNEFYQSPEQMQKWASQREFLLNHYRSQDLNDGLERHPSEVAAIKVSKGKVKKANRNHNVYKT